MDEGSMHQDSLFTSCSQSTKLMEPGDGSFDDPSVDTQATAVRGVSFGQDRLDPQRSEGLAMRLGIIGPITLKLIRPSSGTAHLAGNRRHRPYQWQQLRHIVTVGSGDDRRQRNASGIGQQVMFRSVFPAVHGARAGLRPPKNGPHRGTVDKGSGKVDPVGMPQTIKQQPMELFPYPLLLPVPQSSPTTHARSAAHLPGKIFPRDAGGQDVHNAR